MKHSKSYERDWGLFEGKNNSAITHCEKVKQTIQNKLNEGHPIIWAKNERYCEIDGETFNISKRLFDRLVSSGEIEYHAS